MKTFLTFDEKRVIVVDDSGSIRLLPVSAEVLSPGFVSVPGASTAVEFPLPMVDTSGRQLPSLPPGLTVIVGATGVGKTTMVRALQAAYAAQGGAVRIAPAVVVEPVPADTAPETPLFLDVDSALAWAVGIQTRDSAVLPVLDSLRAPLFETSGAAGPKGIIMPFFTKLTRVSMTLAAHGRTVVATLNPMDESPEFVKEFLQKLSASVPAMIRVDQSDGSALRVTGSYSRRPARQPVMFSLDARARMAPVTIDDLTVSIAPKLDDEVLTSLSVRDTLSTAL